MARNIEIKAKLSEEKYAQIESLARKIGRGPETLIQLDTFFNTHDGRLKIREFTGQKAELISYSRNDIAQPRICNYQRFEIDQPAELKSMLEKSVGIQCVVEKTRTLYLIDQARIHLDDVKHLGLFLEIEVVLHPDQLEEIGQEIMHSLLEQFHLGPDHFESTAYADMILDKQK
ncbi:MAG: class IV adenylate cyclase [Planctomycetota bacterium]|nr:class IV adenylate cyclase [Planctomycetota bacterium]